MRTSIQIADGLIRQVRKETKAATLSGAIRSAIEQFLLQRKKARLIKSFGRYAKWNLPLRRMRRNRDLG